MTNPGYYIGLMSGTSSDGVDVVLIKTHPDFSLIASHHKKFTSEFQHSIHRLADPSIGTIEQLGELDHQLGEIFADAVLELLNTTQISAKKIIAIGSHGQTIRHRPPPHPHPFTLQIGDPNIIAARTGITTVADFRRRDIALGGQGAPLVPAFHKAIFSSDENDRVVVNIGGMANITWLPKSGQDLPILGFDTGPGNVLLDNWIQQQKQLPFDQNGDWAAQGKLHSLLLKKMLENDFFNKSPPKSTGREIFNTNWLTQHINQLNSPIAAVDVQTTLVELTAQSIADSIQSLSNSYKEIYICGGGAFNQFLMQRLTNSLTPNPIFSTAVIGVDPQWVEAMAFAWLAYRRMENKSGNITEVTGSLREDVLGAIYFGR